MLTRLASVLILTGIVVAAFLGTKAIQGPSETDPESITDQSQFTVTQNTSPTRPRVPIRTVSDGKLVSDKPGTFSPPQPAAAIANAEIGAIIKKYLPNASDAERQIWIDQFEGFSAHEIEFIFQQRTPLPNSLSNQTDPFAESTKQRTNPPPATDFGNSENSIDVKERAVRDNIANANTIGYCRWNTEIDTLTANRFRLDTTAGEFVQTNQSLDLATSRFFKVRAGGQDYFTRNGCFEFDAGRIVTRFLVNGERAVLMDGLPKQVAAIDIAANGEVKVATPGESLKRVGKIDAFEFMNPADLKRTEVSCVVQATGATGIPFASDSPNIQQGYLMKSNVKPDEARSL